MKRYALGLMMTVGPLAAQDFDVSVERKMELLRDAALLLQAVPVPPKPGAAPAPAAMPAPAKVFIWDTDSEGTYRAGKRALEKRDWDSAVRHFDRILERKAARADAALYWKAYALSRMGRNPEAIAALGDLARQHAASRWLNDARALEIEIKQSSGQPVSPDAEADEDLKLLALNGLMRSDPERGAPALEKILGSAASPRLKERALFVMAHHRSPRTRDLLLKYARGGTNPDLQARAVEYLGHQPAPEVMQALEEVYSGSGDAAIKRAVLRAWATGRAKDRLLAAARSEKAPELKRDAIRGLGECDADAELWQLLQAETAPEARLEIVRALQTRDESADRLAELAEKDRDPKVRAAAIENLSRIKGPKTLATLMALYQMEKEPEVRRRILGGIRHQNDAKALVEIARSEKDPKLKRMAVEELSEMKSKEAADYLMELVNK